MEGGQSAAVGAEGVWAHIGARMRAVLRAVGGESGEGGEGGGGLGTHWKPLNTSRTLDVEWVGKALRAVRAEGFGHTLE